MADESIIISVKDEVPETPAIKFREMAKEAADASSAILNLTKTLSAMPTTAISRISADLSKIANATVKVQQAQEKAAASTAKNAIAEQKLATELAKTSRAQALAETSQLRLNAARERTIAAQNKVAAVEQSSMDRLKAIAAAGIAEVQARQKQSESYVKAAASGEKLSNALKTVTAEQKAATAAAQLAAAQGQTNAAQLDIEYQAALKNAQIATRNARDKIAADKASVASTEKTVAATKKQVEAMAEVGRQAKLTRNQVLTLQYTASDIVASLGSGISPMTIALQQGPQVAQAFTKELAALGSRFGVVIGSATALAVAVGILGIAYNSAANESAKLNNAIQVTNNYAGITTDGFIAMTDAIAEATNKSIASAREIASILLNTGQFQRQQIEETATSILRLAKLTDTSADEIAKSFVQMAESPGDFAETLNRQYHFLSSAQLQQIRQLEEMGNKTKATEILSRALYDYLAGVDANSLGPLSSAWAWVSKQISNASTNLKEFVAGVGPTKRIAEITKQLQDIEASQRLNPFGPKDTFRTQALIDERNQLEDLVKTENENAAAKSNTAKIQADGYESSKRISNQWLKLADNVNRADAEVKKFREDTARALAANPADKDALAALKNQAAIEKKIRESNMPDSKAGGKVEESRALAIAKINGELDKQVKGFGVLKPQREIQQQLDQYEIDLAARKITLNAEERKSIEDKLVAIQNYNAAQQATDRIFEEVKGPLREYQASLQATDALLKQNVITQEQADQQIQKATQAYKGYLDPLLETNRAIDDQLALLKLSQPERETAQQMQQIENQLRSQGLSLIDKETGALTANAQALQNRLELVQRQTQVQQAYDQIFAQSTGAQQQNTAAVEATNRAYNNGVISAEQYRIRLNQLGIEAAQLRLKMGEALDGDAMLAAFGKVVEGYSGLTSELSGAFGDMFVSLTDGFANAIAGAIMGTESLGDALRNVATQAVEQLIASLIKIGIQYAINAAIGQSLGAAGVAASIAMGTSTAAAWAPAAAMVSLATLGANAVPATAGILSTNAVSMGAALAGFEKGGYTGNMGTKDIAGVVHGQEFVFDAASTARIGVDNLEAMRSGRSGGVEIGGGFQGGASVGSGASVSVTVVNNASNTEVTTSETQDDNGNVDFKISIDTLENALAGRMKSGRGSLHGATKDAFGLQSQATGR